MSAEECALFLDEPIDVVLCSVLVVGNLEHTRHTQQGLLSVSVAHHLHTKQQSQVKDAANSLNINM